MQHEAWISQGWEAEGMTWVVVGRERDPGMISVGAFLVDAWCLGVKNAYVDELTRAELEELLDEQVPAEERETLAPACAKKLIEGAVAYAQGLGFLPHRDFRKARKVLNGLDAAACPREFTFGCDGRPRFVIGPDDDDARVNRVLAVLTARFGEDGFDVEELDDSDAAADGDGEVDWDLLDMFYRFVESEHCRELLPSGFFASGFIAAAVLVEPGRELDEWWNELFGGHAPDLPDNDEFSPEDILDGLLALWTDTEDRFAEGSLVPAIPPLDEPDHFAAAADYCRGFLRVIDARHAVREKVNADPVAAAKLAGLRRLAEPVAADTAAGGSIGRRDAAPVIAEAMRVLHDAIAAPSHT